MSAVLEQTVETEIPNTLSVTIPVTGEVKTGIRPVGAMVEAQAWEIDCAEVAQLASNQRTTWAQRIDQIKKMRADFLNPAKMLYEAATKWFTPALDDLEGGRDVLGRKLLAWDEQEKRRVAAENAAREETARKARQEAEAKAAAERARAEEQAREQRRREQEALEAKRKAEAEGNTRAAAAAAAAAAKAAEAAQAAIENGEAKANEAQLAAAAVQTETVAIPKIAGQSIKENWVAVPNPGITEDAALAMIVTAIVTEKRTDLLALLKLDTAPRGALNKLAAAQKKVMNVPGYTARDVPALAGARK